MGTPENLRPKTARRKKRCPDRHIPASWKIETEKSFLLFSNHIFRVIETVSKRKTLLWAKYSSAEVDGCQKVATSKNHFNSFHFLSIQPITRRNPRSQNRSYFRFATHWSLSLLKLFFLHSQSIISCFPLSTHVRIENSLAKEYKVSSLLCRWSRDARLKYWRRISRAKLLIRFRWFHFRSTQKRERFCSPPTECFKSANRQRLTREKLTWTLSDLWMITRLSNARKLLMLFTCRSWAVSFLSAKKRKMAFWRQEDEKKDFMKLKISTFYKILSFFFLASARHRMKKHSVATGSSMFSSFFARLLWTL